MCPSLASSTPLMMETWACTGGGACTPRTVSCDGYACANGACKLACASSADCSEGYFCEAGRCLAKLPQGQACTSAASCQKGHCVDGVCCDSACNSTCYQCSQPGSVGLCLPVKWGEAAASDCAAGQVCNAQGQCMAEPIASVRFDEGQGSTVGSQNVGLGQGIIASGSFMSGPVAGTWVSSPPPRGTALRFDGVGTFVHFAATPTLDKIVDRFTVAAWVRVPAHPPGYAWAVTRTEPNTFNKIFGLGLIEGRPVAQVHFYSAESVPPLPLGRWVHLAATYDAQVLTLYVDGQVAGRTNPGWPLPPTTTPLVLGASMGNAGGVGQFWRGDIDDVLLLPTVLPPAEIQALMTKP